MSLLLRSIETPSGVLRQQFNDNQREASGENKTGAGHVVSP
jgi:hypothetical protein